MAIEIKAPTFPESVADGTVATWHKKPGDAVKRDELIVDIETDKVVLEVLATADGVLGDIVKGKLHYYPTVTREPFRNQGRISTQINNGTFPQNLGLPDLNPETDRVMLCGSPAMLAELKELLEKRGFKEGNTTTPGDFVIERAFVEK